MLALIQFALFLAALYSGGLWVYIVGLQWFGRGFADEDAAERYTFHLGLSFILAAGFLGLIAKG